MQNCGSLSLWSLLRVFYNSVSAVRFIIKHNFLLNQMSSFGLYDNILSGWFSIIYTEMIAGAFLILDSAVLGPVLSRPPPALKGRGPVAVLMATTLE